MKRGAESFRRPLWQQGVPGMEDVLEQLERSGNIYFVKRLKQTAIRSHSTQKTAMLSMPTQFVRDNGDKIEKWVVLRIHLPHGKSGRPWTVQLSVSKTGGVLFCGGFYAFVTDNRFNEGDSLIFVLRENARSEFEVYTFRRSQGVPHYPDEGDSRSSFPSPSHYQNERTKPLTRATKKGKATPSPTARYFNHHRVHDKEPTSDTREGRVIPSQFANRYHWHKHRVFPSFYKRLTNSNIGRSDREPRTHSGQFELPEGFLRTHAMTIKSPVKLQGIHEHSRTHVIACRQRPGTRFRVDFRATDWSIFVKENRLEKGQNLHFILMADSYFLVRKVEYY